MMHRTCHDHHGFSSSPTEKEKEEARNGINMIIIVIVT